MIEVSLVVLAGLTAASLLQRQSAALRHWVLSVTLACAVAAPFVDPIAPLRFGPALSSSGAPSGPAVDVPPSGPAAPPERGTAVTTDRFVDSLRDTAQAVLVPVWIVGAVLSLSILLAGFARLAWLASRAERVTDGRWRRAVQDLSARYALGRPVTLLRADHPTLTVTWGALRPEIIVPRGSGEWTDGRVRIVLAHELAHVRRRDWLAQIVAEVLRAIYWFNPLLWMAARRLRQESEQACDDAVLALGVDGRDYASHLVDLARAAREHRRSLYPGFPVPAMVRPSSLERRVSAMLNTQLNRSPLGWPGRLTALSGLLIVTVVAGGFGAAAQTFARFSGSVIDPMNSGIPKVTVQLVNTRTEAKYEVRSDDHGRFEFIGLPEGEYRLEAQFPGFKVFRGTVVVSGQDVQRNVALQVGTLQETITVRGSASAPTTPDTPATRAVARTAVECTAASSGGNIRPPRKLRDVRPIYPEHLQRGRVSGTVLFDAVIGTNGIIRELKVVQSPHAELASAAADAIRQWEFDATLLNCVPVEVSMRVIVKFDVE